MISTLEELVFGLNSYEKVKIEDRYEEIHSILLDSHSYIIISTIEEFDTLEQCLFKIQDQLRVKSSNLNSIIKKPNSLTKKKIETIITLLKSKREEILQFAFSKSIKRTLNLDDNSYETVSEIIEESNSNNNNSETISKKNSENISTEYNDLDVKIEKKLEEKNEKKIEENSTKQEPNNNNNNNNNKSSYEILNHGKVGISLKSNTLNLVEAKLLLEKLYSTHLYNSTLLYVASTTSNSIQFNKNELLCLGISATDTITIPFIQRTNYIENNLQFVFDTITKYKDSKLNHSNKETNLTIGEDDYKDISQQKKSIKEELIKEENNSSEINNNNYISINNEIKTINTHKYEEDSLENLVLSHNDPDKYTRGISHNEKDNSVNLESDDSIIVEKKEPFGDKEDKSRAKTEEVIKTYSSDENRSDNSDTVNELSSLVNEKNNNLNKYSQSNIDLAYAIYSDEVISIKVSERGYVRSQLSVIFNNNQYLLYQQPNSIAHAILFSKHFLTSMFESIKCDATILVTSLFSNSFELLPRYQNDNVFSLGGQSIGEEELNKIQKQIESRLVEELQSQELPTTTQRISVKDEVSSSNSQDNSSKQNTSDEDSSKKRARYLLSSLRRIG